MLNLNRIAFSGWLEKNRKDRQSDNIQHMGDHIYIYALQELPTHYTNKL